MKTDIRKIAEVIANEIIAAEKQITEETKRENDLWWARFLKSQGQVHLWRKGIITQHMLIEERCEVK